MSFDRKTLAIVIAVAVLAIGVGGALLYMKSGMPAREAVSVAPPPAPPRVWMPPSQAPGQTTGKASLTLDQAADRLSKRLERQEGSADDWTLLARSYVELKRYPEAVRAFEQALKKSPNDAQLRKEADAARQAAGGPPETR